jgi:perosamine synthetase
MIPVNEPLLDGNEKKYLCECIDTGWISSDGPFVKKFEDRFAGYIGCQHGIAVCNGTAALEVAVAAAGIHEGDEVILPSFTIISCAWAVVRLGAIPVFIDAEPETWCMDVNQIEKKITKKTKAIMTVHIYGHPVDMDPVSALAEKYGLFVIEDAAEVHGAEYKGQKCGSLGHIAAFSFYANKIITTGEGGMVLTNNEKMAEKALSYRNLAFRPEKRFLHTEAGYNFRMTNLQAAVGLAQMERIDEFIEIKRRNASLYFEALNNVPFLQLPREKEWAKNVYWMFSIVINEKSGVNAAEMACTLKEKGIMTRPFFLGLHEQPVLEKFHSEDKFPVTELISKYGLYLPSGMTLTEAQIEQVGNEVKNILSGSV